MLLYAKPEKKTLNVMLTAVEDLLGFSFLFCSIEVNK